MIGRGWHGGVINISVGDAQRRHVICFCVVVCEENRVSFVSQEDGERFVFFISFKMNGKSLLCSDPLESSEGVVGWKITHSKN